MGSSRPARCSCGVLGGPSPWGRSCPAGGRGPALGGHKAAAPGTGCLPLPANSCASGGPPTPNTHTRPVGLDGHPPHRECAVSDPGVPRRGVLRRGWRLLGPAEGNPRMAVTRLASAGRVAPGLQGGLPKHFDFSARRATGDQQQPVRTPGMPRAPQCRAWPWCLGAHSSPRPRAILGCAGRRGEGRAVLPAGRAGDAHRSAVSEPRVAGAAFCSLPLAQTLPLASQRCSVRARFVVFCYFLKVHKLGIFWATCGERIILREHPSH